MHEILTTAMRDLEKLGYVVVSAGVKGDKLSIKCFPPASPYYEEEERYEGIKHNASS
jgi:hypothetical protein